MQSWWRSTYIHQLEPEYLWITSQLRVVYEAFKRHINLLLVHKAEKSDCFMFT